MAYTTYKVNWDTRAAGPIPSIYEFWPLDTDGDIVQEIQQKEIDDAHAAMNAAAEMYKNF